MPSKPILIVLVAVYAVLGGAFYYLGKSSASASENPEHGASANNNETEASSSSRSGSEKKKGTRSFRLEDVEPSTKNIKQLDALSLNNLMKEIEAAFGGGVQDQAAIGRAWNMIQLLGDQDLDGALDYAENVAPPKGQFLTLLLLPRLAQFRGAEAMTALNERLPAGQLQMSGTMMVLMSWGGNDPDAAFDWYLKDSQSETGNAMLKSGMMGGMIIGNLVSNLARKDLNRAFQRLEAIEDKKLRAGALTSLAQLGNQAAVRERLFSEFAQIEDDQLRRMASGQLASSWARSEPRQAMEWAKSLEDEEDRETTSSMASHSWIRSEPEAAGNYLLEHAEPDGRQKILNQVTSNWASNDSRAALAWLKNNSEGEERDQALTQGVANLAYSSPETALAWASEMGTEEGRSATATTAFQTITQQSGREAAIKALQESGLSEGTVQTIIEANPESPAPAGASFEASDIQSTTPAE